MVTDDELVVFKKKKDVISSELSYLKFDKIDNSYDYLLNMKLYSLTHESITELNNECSATVTKLEFIKKTSEATMWKTDLC